MTKKGLRHMERVIIVFLASWLLIFPVIAHAQLEGDPAVLAKAEAKKHVSALLWIIAGCCTIGVAVLIGYLLPISKVPAVALMGKSPEYVFAYTRAYEKEVKKRQGKYALIGFGIYVVLDIIAILADPDI